ncbi:MAG: hypothetical protein JJE49_05170 [Peptostreptococcaceae bacterium]|nr:hypothetical protein [Peptostreptococcaceae bacterium]
MLLTNPWPVIIKEISEIPEHFKESFKAISEEFGEGKEFDDFPYCIYLEKSKWGEIIENEKMICDFEDKIIIMENIDGEVKSLIFLHSNINYINNGRILLYSWIQINGVIDGNLETCIFIFNTTSENKFIKLITDIRKRMNGIFDEEISSNPEFEFLYPDNLKFLNYSNRSVIEGEKVLFTIFQESMYTKYFMMFDKKNAPNHILILCDKELIIISETMTKNTDMDDYSGVWAYISLKKITNVGLSENEIGQFVLNITLEGNDIISSTYQKSKKEELEALTDQLKHK